MHRSAPIRFTAAASLALSASLLAQTPPARQANSPASPQQSTLPATSPTTTPAPPPIPLTPAQLPPKRAKITFAGGVLSISADNASLNQILRQIATDTGMKICQPYSTAPAATWFLCIATATRPQNSSSPRARADRLPPVPTLPSSTTDQSRERLRRSRSRNPHPSSRGRPTRSTLRRALAPRPEPLQPTPPSPNPPMGSKRRSRSTSSCSACASSSNSSSRRHSHSHSHKLRRSNSFLVIIPWGRKSGAAIGMPQVKTLKILALDHLGRRHHGS
jgi:hypothetical protein